MLPLQRLNAFLGLGLNGVISDDLTEEECLDEVFKETLETLEGALGPLATFEDNSEEATNVEVIEPEEWIDEDRGEEASAAEEKHKECETKEKEDEGEEIQKDETLYEEATDTGCDTKEIEQVEKYAEEETDYVKEQSLLQKNEILDETTATSEVFLEQEEEKQAVDLIEVEEKHAVDLIEVEEKHAGDLIQAEGGLEMVKRMSNHQNELILKVEEVREDQYKIRREVKGSFRRGGEESFLFFMFRIFSGFLATKDHIDRRERGVHWRKSNRLELGEKVITCFGIFGSLILVL